MGAKGLARFLSATRSSQREPGVQGMRRFERRVTSELSLRNSSHSLGYIETGFLASCIYKFSSNSGAVLSPAPWCKYGWWWIIVNDKIVSLFIFLFFLGDG